MKIVFCSVFFLMSVSAYGGLFVEPYVNIASTKSLKTNKANASETEKTSERREAGVKAGLKLGKLFSLYLAGGQSTQITTSSEEQIVDQFAEIDFAKDLNMRTAGKETKIIETQNKAKFGVDIHPSFSIFILRAAVGVSATQRLLKAYEDNILLKEIRPEPSYKPFAGAGLGIKFGPTMYALAQYNFNFYMYPKAAPFEREVSISYGLSLK